MFPKNKSYSFQNNSLPDVKLQLGVKNRLKDKESRAGRANQENSGNNEKLLERENSPKARNTQSLQPNNEIELLKLKLKHREQIDNTSEGISLNNNIRVIKPADLDIPIKSLNNKNNDARSKDLKHKDILLPKISSSDDIHQNEYLINKK
jgi:hypothetical protein